jgi:hypothetical protein
VRIPDLRRPGTLSRIGATALASLATGLAASVPAQAATVRPPGPPGAPPGADVGYPAVGAAAPTAATGPATVISTGSPPGLLGGSAKLKGRTVSFPIACSRSGSVRLSGPAPASTASLGRASYRCVKGQATVSIKLSAASVRRLPSTALTTVALGARQFTLTVSRSSAPTPYWKGAGMQCDFFGANSSFLEAPNFTLSPAATVDVRPWLAVYTAKAGWQWIGTGGPNRSSWYQWTATPSGISQWVTPFGALNPWTWGPISVRPGVTADTVGVFEVEYMYAHPAYVWGLTRSDGYGVASGPYCASS